MSVTDTSERTRASSEILKTRLKSGVDVTLKTQSSTLHKYTRAQMGYAKDEMESFGQEGGRKCLGAISGTVLDSSFYHAIADTDFLVCDSSKFALPI